MKRLNNKGFTLIELLAVITILGILMMVAIPSISTIINNSRRDTLLANIKAYANEVKTAWAADRVTCRNGSSGPYVSPSGLGAGTYIVTFNTGGSGLANSNAKALITTGGKSPWGNADIQGNVKILVTTDPTTSKETIKYYVKARDTGNHGYSGNSESDDIVKTDIANNVGTGNITFSGSFNECKID